MHAELVALVRELVRARGPGKSICPSEVARAYARDCPACWELPRMRIKGR